MPHRSLHRTAQVAPVVLLLAALLVGCGGSAGNAPAPVPTTAPAQPTDAPAQPTAAAAAQPTAAPAADGDEAIKAAIQQTLDLYAQAYNENNPELLAQVADQQNLPFRRFVQTRFDNFQQSIFAGQVEFGYTVKSVTERDLGFVEAQVERSGTGLVNDWTFRKDGDRWIMSEPSEKQIGERQKTETDGFTFLTYPWADDVNPTIIKLMEEARQQVKERLGKLPDSKAEVTIKPIFGVGKPESPNALAYYDRNGRGKDRIVIFAPKSYVFQSYDPTVGWEAELKQTLVHEYVHLVNHRSFKQLSRMSDWMVEGLAEYVSDSPRANEVSLAVRSDNIIPIIDTSGRVDKQDLEKLSILEKDRSLAYGLAYSLVAFINEKHGGMDGYWKLVDAYDKPQNLDTALKDAFGISYEQFDQEWRAWLKEKY